MSGRIGRSGYLSAIACQAFPEFAELFAQFFIIQISQPFARNYHNIQTRSAEPLVEPEGLANLSFEAIAFNGELDAFLADHQTQTGMFETVVPGEQQNVLAWSLAGG